MLWNTAIDSTARGHALAGFSFLMIAISAAVQGADVASLPTHPLRGIDGRRIDLMAPPHGAMTIIFYSTECPISNSYSPTLATLVDSFAGKSVKWLGVCVDPDLSDSDVTAHARDFGLKFPVVRDRHGSLARKLGAQKTPEAFVIDDRGKIRYHGRIDDQFVARRKRNANPSESELKDAIAAVLNGKEVSNAVGRGRRLPAARDARGSCEAHLLQGRRTDSAEKLPGMPSARARSVRSPSRLTIRRASGPPTSPRWSRTGRCPHGRPSLMWESNSRTSRTLSDDEIATLVAWSEADAPEGNLADLPLST